MHSLTEILFSFFPQYGMVFWIQVFAPAWLNLLLTILFFFGALVYRTIFLISSLNHLLLVCRNANEFYPLNFQLTALLNQFLSLRTSLDPRFSVCKALSSTNGDWICLTALPRSSPWLEFPGQC